MGEQNQESVVDGHHGIGNFWRDFQVKEASWKELSPPTTPTHTVGIPGPSQATWDRRSLGPENGPSTRPAMTTTANLVVRRSSTGHTLKLAGTLKTQCLLMEIGGQRKEEMLIKRLWWTTTVKMMQWKMRRKRLRWMTMVKSLDSRHYRGKWGGWRGMVWKRIRPPWGGSSRGGGDLGCWWCSGTHLRRLQDDTGEQFFQFMENFSSCLRLGRSSQAITREKTERSPSCLICHDEYWPEGLDKDRHLVEMSCPCGGIYHM